MNKNVRFAFKLPESDKRQLFMLADTQGEQVAVILRRLIREAIAMQASSEVSSSKMGGKLAEERRSGKLSEIDNFGSRR